MCSGAQSSLTSSHRPLQLQHVREHREVQSGPTNRLSRNMFGNISVERCKAVPQTATAATCLGAQRSQALPQTVRPSRRSEPQRGPKWSYRPLELQNIRGHRGPKWSHRPIELQKYRRHREVPSGPTDR